MAKSKQTKRASASTNGADGAHHEKLNRDRFDEELLRLQRELVIMQEYVRAKGLKMVVIFEGRDAAGKGGVIKRIMERTNPRSCRVVALPAPTEREKTPVVLPALRARICRPRARSSCSTAPGTTAPGSSG